ncbi:hypothetical protein LAUMK41_01909 [Mycobacterium attenuatum]|nr:hypothetical protein LAUMK41_01909 [Mycobacterium attenuatum]
MSWLDAATAGARARGTSGGCPAAVSEAGVGNDHCGGAERDHVGGRSRFRPGLLNGLWPLEEEPWSELPVARVPISLRAGPIPTASCDATTGSANHVARSTRNAQHPARADSKLRAATTAMACCHRVDPPRPRKLTVHPLYQRWHRPTCERLYRFSAAGRAATRRPGDASSRLVGTRSGGLRRNRARPGCSAAFRRACWALLPATPARHR